MRDTTELHAENPEQLFHALVDVVDGLLVARSKYVVIERSPSRYVQALVDGDGALQIETVSNGFLEAEARLSAGNEALLDHMRWSPPSDHSPNWHRTFVHQWPWPAPVAAQLLAYALLTVHDVGSEPLALTLTLTYGDAASAMHVRPCDEQCRMLAA